MFEFTNYAKLIEDFTDREVQYEFSNIGAHTSVRMQGTEYPNSVTETEFMTIRDVIVRNNLKRGFEVGTGFGMSTLACGLGFKKTGGKIVTIDAYHEESIQNPTAENKNEKHPESRGYKSVKQLVEEYDLKDTVFPIVGWSPADSLSAVNSVHGKELIDFVFIDAFHTPEAVFDDFNAIKDRINKDRCVVVFHDADTITHILDQAAEFIGASWSFKSEPPNGFFLAVIEKA